jgi:predicted enzyme related to lactoylglutathione lyase
MDGVQTIIFPVGDLAAAKTLFSALVGAGPENDSPYYVGYKVAGQDIGLDPRGHRHGAGGATPYFHVDDIETRLKALVEAGAETVQPIKDVGGGRLIAAVKDADGNAIGLLQNPPA